MRSLCPSRLRLVAVLGVAAASLASPAAGDDYLVLPGPSGLLPILPDAVVDLRSKVGADVLGAHWRFRDAKVKETSFHGPGPDLGPTGTANRTYDIFPRPGLPGFEESPWEAINAESLEKRRTAGRVSFAWYSVNLTLPAQVGAGTEIGYKGGWSLVAARSLPSSWTRWSASTGTGPKQ